MFYYKKNIGDYFKKAGRLSMLQHGAYTLLIDACYDREQFPNHEEAIEWSWASTPDELQAVDFVLKKFFTLIDGKYIQNRIKEDLENYQKNCKINQKIAVKREEKRKNSTNREPFVNEPPPNQEPRTKNQEPRTKKKIESSSRGSRLTQSWIASEEYLQFCIKERPDLDPQAMQDKFRDYWSSVSGRGGVKLDWLATWRNFVRSERGQLPQRNTPASSIPWWATDETVLAKGNELGLEPRPGEWINQFKGRIQGKLNGK